MHTCAAGEGGGGGLPWICWDFLNDVCLINKNKEGEGGVKMMMKKNEKFPLMRTEVGHCVWELLAHFFLMHFVFMWW